MIQFSKQQHKTQQINMLTEMRRQGLINQAPMKPQNATRNKTAPIMRPTESKLRSSC